MYCIFCRPKGKSSLVDALLLGPEPYQRGKMLMLTNKAPQWNRIKKSWMLDMGSRVRVSSVKNFQLVKLSNRNRWNHGAVSKENVSNLYFYIT